VFAKRLGVLAAMTLVALINALAAPTAAVRLTASEHAFFAAINQTRVEHGLAALTLDGNLVEAARFHSSDMVAHDYFAHGVFWRRLQSFGTTAGFLGENLGWSADQDPIRVLISLWLHSPEHRAVLLNRGFRSVGIGVAVGPFHGFPHALVVTTDFSGP
jgi:uncharacterized protein YkwD